MNNVFIVYDWSAEDEFMVPREVIAQKDLGNTGLNKKYVRSFITYSLRQILLE
jgi:hypothetical protein